MQFSIGQAIALIALFSIPGAQLQAQDSNELTSKQKSEIRKIAVIIDRAGKQYQAARYDDTVETVKEAEEKLFELLGEPTKELLAAVKPQYDRIAQAYKLLEENGQSPGQLKALPTIAMAEGELSFVNQIAPILLNNCGRCHVDRTSGGFGMANFEALVSGPGVAPERPEVSRIIEVIEDGEMPPNGEVSAEDLETLKTWIKAGAEFDGENEQANLRQLVDMNSPAEDELEISSATGNETVSFSLDIAPMFIDNCGGCHVEVQNNPRGGLNMTTFRQLLNGGDSGPIVTPGKGEESFLVQKLKGMGGGQRMPVNRPAFSDEQVEKVITWINEGARFDGRSPRLSITQVAALARAESMTHEELAADRLAGSERTWKLAMTDVESRQMESNSFLMMGTAKEDRLQEINDLAEEIVPEVNSFLKRANSEPIVKGRMTIFVFDKRYDYSEFGKMVESRDLPSHFVSHWGYDTINAYAAVLSNPRKAFDADSFRADFCQHIAAVAVRDLAVDVPKWFADGAGFVIAKKTYPRDESARQWTEKADAAVKNMNRPDDFVQDRMPEDQAALVSYLFVSSLMKDSGSFNKLLRLISEGATFDEGFNEVYGGSAAELINNFYGQNNRRGRR